MDNKQQEDRHMKIAISIYLISWPRFLAPLASLSVLN